MAAFFYNSMAIEAQAVGEKSSANPNVTVFGPSLPDMVSSIYVHFPSVESGVTNAIFST